MYEIIKDKKSIAFVEKLTYIKKSDGVYMICAQEKAQGIAVNGVPYSLLGVGEMEGCETVVAVERDTGSVIASKSAPAEILFITAAENGQIDDVTAGEHIEMFLPWLTGTEYDAGNIRAYGGKLYRCVQGHTSQDDWTPDAVPALWVLIADPAVEFPPWSQPIGTHDAYELGDKVTYADNKWISDISGNVWAPGVYGWSIYAPSEEEGGENE